MPKRNRNGIAAQRLKEIREYVNFDYNLNKPLTSYAKAKIRRYWREVEKLKARPNQVVKPRDPWTLRKVQKFAGHNSGFPGLKVAFVPTDGKNRVKVQLNARGQVVAKANRVTQRFIPFEPARLATEGAAYVAGEIAASDGQTFTIRAGAYEIGNAYSKERIPAVAEKLAAKYDVKGNHNFRNWLKGVNVYNFARQASPLQYFRAKMANKIKKKKSDRAARRRSRRERMTGRR